MTTEPRRPIERLNENHAAMEALLGEPVEADSLPTRILLTMDQVERLLALCGAR